MTSDALKLNLVMTVSPADPGTRSFGPAVQYVWHVVSRTGDPSAVVAHPELGTETKVICTFTSNTAAKCWVVSGTTVKDYVEGDPTTAMTSADGKFKVHAGKHSDPFFFNLQGFRNAIKLVHDNFAALTGLMDAAGCPTNLPATGALSVQTVRDALTTQQPTDAAATPPCSATTPDCFASLNVMAIVVQVDKTLVNQTGNTNLAVWASTHATP